jgi:hypothetical protein
LFTPIEKRKNRQSPSGFAVAYSPREKCLTKNHFPKNFTELQKSHKLLTKRNLQRRQTLFSLKSCINKS